LTHFEFFREKCKTTQFVCHVFYTDYVLETIENDLPRLLSINEDKALYFHGAWKQSEHNGWVFFIETSSSSGSQRNASHIHGFFPHFLDTKILFDLCDMGVGLDTVKSLIPKLYEVYSRQAKAAGDIAYRNFVENWETYYMKGWRAEYQSEGTP